mmetsp:Transcript_79962/g.158965  ORF Transcript_79962/g.158965 Transcript_79962/m.158965 type:complete len:130 (-) Transcript_79962:203-592(-)
MVRCRQPWNHLSFDDALSFAMRHARIAAGACAFPEARLALRDCPGPIPEEGAICWALDERRRGITRLEGGRVALSAAGGSAACGAASEEHWMHRAVRPTPTTTALTMPQAVAPPTVRAAPQTAKLALGS